MHKLYPFARSFLFALDPETAHDLAFFGLDRAAKIGVAGLVAPRLNATPVSVMGINFPNRVGLAAGLDKNAQHLAGLATFGFGFLEAGTVTPRPQPGNPKPRMWRLPQAQALINRLGFNNDGVDRFLAISSPNTRGLRELQAEGALAALLGKLQNEREALAQQHGRHVPIVVKIAPDLTDDAIRDIAHLLLQHHCDGVIATNTTIAREGVAGMAHADETGGLSGGPVRERSTAVIRTLARTLDGALPIIGVGGILSGADAREKVAAGASLVQIYTGLIYRGPELVEECVNELSKP